METSFGNSSSTGTPTRTAKESNPQVGPTLTQTQLETGQRLLPDQPLVVIEPGRGWAAFDARDLWKHRELLYFLVWRDVKVRYKQTALGVAWAVLQPLFMMLVFTLFFARVAGDTVGKIPYPLFAFAGLVPWTFFANAVTTASNSLVGNAHLVTKVYFPRLLVPIASVGGALVDFALSLTLMAVVLLYYRIGLTWNIVALPGLILLCVIFALAVGTWLAGLNVKYRDVRFVLPFAIQLWLFLSSVILPSTAVPARWRWLLALNPMSAVIEGFRSSLLGLPFNWMALGIATALTLLALLYAVYSFRRVEREFADII
jgi:lipopolysaccharide transport system permease protein